MDSDQSVGETEQARDRLSCPACNQPGGSPIGMVNWVCKNAECPIETFRVIDHDDPAQIEEDNE